MQFAIFIMMIDLFKDLKLPAEKLHPKFVLLNGLMLANEREILMSWTDGFVDRDNKIVKQFQTTFHSSFWEFYLHHFFKEQRFSVDYSHARPDFIVTAPEKFYVEAVVANVKETGRQKATRGLEDILDNLIPPFLQNDFEEQMNEAIVRYSSAIQTKINKLEKEYRTLSWVDHNKPFVIALSSYAQVNYGKEYFYPMFALLYGLFYDPITKDYSQREHINKPGTTSTINVALFDDPAFENVSAIIFSCTVTTGKLTSLSKSQGKSSTQTVLIIREEYEFPHYMLQDVNPESPEIHADGLFIFHNPNAKVKLSPATFAESGALQIMLDEDGVLQFFGTREPMLVRLNIPTLWVPPPTKKFVFESTFQAFNNIRLPGY